jgi:hypothetical protein
MKGVLMKKLCLSLALVALLSCFAAAQVGPVPITSNQCAVVLLSNHYASVAITVSGTWTGTLQPQVIVQGQSPANVQVKASSSASPQNTITANGVFTASVAGVDTLQVCGATVSSGTANVYANPSSATSSNSSGSGSGATSCAGLSDSSPSCSIDATLVANVVGAAPLSSPALTGTPTAPTPITADNSTKVATTAFVKAQGYATTSSLAAVATSGSASDLGTGTLPAGRLPVATTSTFGGVKDLAAVANNFITSILGGVPVQGRPTCANLSDSGTGCSATLAPVATSGSATDLGAGTLNNARLPAAISTTTLTASGAVTGGSFVGTSAAGVGNYHLCAEGTDPGNEAAGQDLEWCSSSSHRRMLSNNNATSQQIVVAGADVNNSDQVQQLHEANTSVNNAASPYTVLSADSKIRCDATAGNVTINLPAATGTKREIAYKKIDSTGNTCTLARAGSDLIDGQTSIVLNMQWESGRIQDSASAAWDKFGVVAIPISGGGTGATVASATTNFATLNGLGAPNAVESLRVGAFPWNGILQHVCISQGAQTSAGVTYTIREWTNSTAAGADTAITWTVASSATAGTYCDDTHQLSITSTKGYSIKIVEASGAATGALYGISAVYIPTVF